MRSRGGGGAVVEEEQRWVNTEFGVIKTYTRSAFVFFD